MLRIFVVCVFMAILAPLCLGVTIGQVDDFSDGTAENWIVSLLGAPHPAPPENVPDDGPGGPGDNFLRLTALGGAGPGSRLSALNLVQWSGDYLAAGVNAIAMDVRNSGSTDLYIRLLLEGGAGGGPPTDWAISQAVFLPAGSSWQSVVVNIGPGSLTTLQGSENAALTQTIALRILHDQDAAFPPATVTGILDVDNLTAAQIPEPASLILAGSAIAAGWLRRLAARRQG